MNRFSFRAFLAGVLVLSTGLLSFAGERKPFKVYAPSRNGECLIILEVTPAKEDKFPYAELKLIDSVTLDFPARTIAQHPTKPLLYLSGGPNKTSAANFGMRHLNPKTEGDKGGVTGTLPRSYSYLSVDHSGKFLLGCNYQEGIIDIYTLQVNGMPEAEPVATLEEGRKAAHCVLLSPDNRHFYIPYVKENNALYQYQFDAVTGEPTALDPMNAGPPEGTGPRHLAYHPTLPILYFSEEQGLGVSIYQRDVESGKLKFLESVSSVPGDAPEEGVSASDIMMTPDGKFLYTGIRGHKHDFDFVAGYAVQEDGGLKPLGLTETSAVPWGLAVSPDSNFLVVSAFKGGEILLYRIGDDGSLKKAASLPVDEGISDLETR